MHTKAASSNGNCTPLAVVTRLPRRQTSPIQGHPDTGVGDVPYFVTERKRERETEEREREEEEEGGYKS